MSAELLIAIALLCETDGNSKQTNECKQKMLQCIRDFSKSGDSIGHHAETLVDCYLGVKGNAKK